MIDSPIFEINELERALLTMDNDLAEVVIKKSLLKDNPIRVASELVSLTLQRIGDSWEAGHLSLSQVYMSGVICEEIIDKILPKSDVHRKSQPKMAIGVFEDFHLLGKRIIYSTLRASGYELMDLGGGLHTDALVEIIHNEDIKIMLLSVLMLPSALKIKELTEKLADSDVKIIVGGAPFRFDSELWKEIGADGCGNDSVDAIELINKLMEEKS